MKKKHILQKIQGAVEKKVIRKKNVVFQKRKIKLKLKNQKKLGKRKFLNQLTPKPIYVL